MKKSPGSLFLIMLMILLSHYQSAGQEAGDTNRTTVNKGRLTGVLVTHGTLYLGSLTGLYFAWYKDYPQSSFHFFDDNGEWMQMDKLGHTTASYYISRIGYESYKWAGVNENMSIIGGTVLSLAFMTNIEILDGFSSGWGFSAGDMIANTAGCLLFAGQQLAWHDQRFIIKYSFHPTKYAAYRPDLLGSSFIQRSIKDYNGSNYWLSGNISSFLPKGSKFPKWIDVSFGYGAEGMTGATANDPEVPEFERYRQFYLSLDVDLTRIPVKHKGLRYVFMVLNFIKIPFPAVEFNTLGQVKFHPIYF